MESLSEEQKNDLMELQSIQQQMQLVLMQKQQLLLQQNETGKALEEIGKASGKLYRLAGSVMVEKEKSVLQSELKEEKESVEVRLSAFGKQEKKLKDRFEELRKKLEKSLPRQPSGESASLS
ncbi:prefoldin subunit beta [Candidatus Micrarchaeota archaeon]|nr:prefoldin subunit beta [Candidatus Micrarchaeota archaeon]